MVTAGTDSWRLGVYKLIIEDDEGHTTIVPLVKEEITIGRKEGNTIRLTERNISRRHARMIKSSGSVFVEDLDSYNGVKVNGDKITGRTSVREGDLIEIGDYHFALQWAEGDEPGAEPQVASVPVQPPPLDVAVGEHATVEEDPQGSPTPLIAQETPSVDIYPEVSGSQNARLFVMNTELAGKEYPLGQNEVIIGRTEENDIVLSHVSVSGRHAKIVFDEGVLRIVDLGSANGVTVNGEIFSRTELKEGDVIELGQVKLRFVVDGVVKKEAESKTEAELDKPTSSVADLPTDQFERLEFPSASKHGNLWLALSMVLLAGGLFFWLQTRPAKHAPREYAADKPANAQTEPSEKSASPQAVDPQIVKLVEDGKAKLAQWDFAGAVEVLGQALQKAPGHQEAQALKQLAEREREYSDRIAKAKEAIASKNYHQAFQFLRQIPADSAVSKSASELLPEVRKKFLAYHLQVAARLDSSGQLDEALQHVEIVLGVDPQNPYANNLKSSLTAKQKPQETDDAPAAADGPEKSTASLSPTPAVPAGPKKKREPPKDYSETIKKGVRLVNNKEFDEAILVFNSVVKADPRNCDGLLGIGVIYASTGKQDKAAVYYQRFISACPKHVRAPDARQTLKQYFDFRRQQSPTPTP